MSTTVNNTDLREAALELAKANIEAEPDLQQVYWFPSEEEIRLVLLDPTIAPSRDEEVFAPFYFGSNKAAGVPYPSAIALIHPKDKDRLQPPDGWGNWKDAESIGRMK